MEKLSFELNTPEYSYMIGFMQADGHLHSSSRNRGRMAIEVSQRDIDIINKLQKIIPVNSTIYTRIRKTNFSNNIQFTATTLNVFDLEFRNTINYYGIPYGKKSNIIEPPKQAHSEIDYWRGIIDADGSLGITNNNLPFIALVTASENLYLAFKIFLKKSFNIDISLNRNKRDNVYNIMITREKAQDVVQKLYYDNCLVLDRKKISAEQVMNWSRPIHILKKGANAKWTSKEILFLKNNTIDDCIKYLHRTENSIRIKKQRLKN